MAPGTSEDRAALEDARAERARAGGKRELLKISEMPNRTFGDVIHAHADATPDKTAIIFEGRHISYREFDALIDGFAGWALDQGITPGTCVAIMLDNSPDYLAAWLGLNRIGAVGALLNTDIKGVALEHAFEAAGCRIAIWDDVYAAALNSLDDDVRFDLDIHHYSSWNSETLMNHAVAACAEKGLGADARHLNHVDDLALYVYTSGTTGHPKAAKISHRRVFVMSVGIYGAVEAGPDDVVLDMLPMYHISGGMCAPGMAFMGGGTLVLARRFSASQFWELAHEHGATLTTYVGEICRYLVNAPEHPRERDHKFRAFTGAGLREAVWAEMERRFGIPWIIEYFGATEGNVALANFEGHLGSIGRVPDAHTCACKLQLIRVDAESGEALRDDAGNIIICDVDEPGEAIGRIGSSAENDGRPFEGYTDDAATEQKILRDVIEPGDAWFRSGDLFRRDAKNFFYFVDRMGETYRWKSHNVSANEVADLLTQDATVLEASVFGVEVPGHEGRAGMAAIATTDDFDLAAFSEHVRDNLASYARPLFLRLVDAVTVTGNFKVRKVELKEAGFYPEQVDGPLYIWDDGYRLLEDDDWQQIQAGEARF